MTPPVLSIGPFDLLEPVARGGMAHVWRGVHREQGTPVAVKIVTAAPQHRSEFERRFADEIRAVAALDHPGVVMVLDHGRIPDAFVHPKVPAGASWLAMEWASGGTLATNRAPLPWPMLKSVLLALLDALAHAHAHGVVHRDLKPPNVLLATPHDLRPGLKLSDFGIAFASGATGDEGEVVVGTPSYMAPEQVRGDWRDLGPWTDLYAFGCLTWWLCTGAPPFAGQRPQQTMMAHLSSELPPFVPRMPVPDGFVSWLHKLLEKRFSRRFQFAADAAWGLASFAAPPLGDRDSEVMELDPAFQQTITHTDVSFGESWRLSIDEAPTPHEPTAAPRPPPIATSWRTTVAKPPPVQLVGAGLSLYGLRAVQLAGREEERDQLWTDLLEVERTGRARVVLIHGPAGTGKSRLVEWLCRRAHELGAANMSKATFGPEKAPGQALQEMAFDQWRTRGLAREDVERRVRAWLWRFGPIDEAEASVLTELLHPATRADLERGIRPARLTTPREYYAGTVRSMARVASQRPLITWFDDVQYGYHGLGVALQVLRSQDDDPFPCLLVLTMRTEALDDSSDEARRVAKLLETPGVRVMHLGPLPPGSHRELVRRLLGLDDALAAQVEERTGGNPLFAVQLVGSWVQSGTLEVAERGFRLKPGARVELPDDLHAVWSSHLSRILADFPANSQEFLEVAACLGQEVRSEEWRRACDDPHGLFGDRYKGDEPLRASLVEHLLSARLIVGSRRRWSFVHGMLRESLERTARTAGRWRQHNEACAAMLGDRADDPQVTERLGRHLLEAGAVDQALEPLLRGVAHRLMTVGPQPAQALLATIEAEMVALRVPASDERWGRLWELSARVYADIGTLEERPTDPRATEPPRVGSRSTEALAFATRAGEAAAEHGWREVAAAAAQTEARLLIRLARYADAEQLLRQLEATARRDDDRASIGAALVGRAEIARRKGEPIRVVEHLHQAVPHLEAAVAEGQSPIGLARAELEWGRAAADLGDDATALRKFESALSTFDAAGSVLGAAECADRWGRLAVARGDLETAERMLGRALSQYEALGSPRALPCRMRLARVVLRRDPNRTWAVVERVEARFARLDHKGRLTATFALRLVRNALDRDWAGWDETFEEAIAHAPRPEAAVAAAWLGWLAADAARLAGERKRASQAAAAAATLFTAAGLPALAEEVGGGG